MNILNLIARLPNELKHCIFNYIDIDSRIELMTYVYNKRLFLEYIDVIPTEKNVQLFDKFITNKILTYKQRTTNSYKSWYIKSSVSKLFPVVKYKIDTTKDEKDTTVPEYIQTAAEHISSALRHEAEEDIEQSLAAYRAAIGGLLVHVQSDPDTVRQAQVKRRIAQYISKAEQLGKVF